MGRLLKVWSLRGHALAAKLAAGFLWLGTDWPLGTFSPNNDKQNTQTTTRHTRTTHCTAQVDTSTHGSRNYFVAFSYKPKVHSTSTCTLQLYMTDILERFQHSSLARSSGRGHTAYLQHVPSPDHEPSGTSACSVKTTMVVVCLCTHGTGCVRLRVYYALVPNNPDLDEHTPHAQ